MVKAAAQTFLILAAVALGPYAFAQPASTPALSSTLFTQAEENYRKRDYDKAITQYTAYLRLRPDSAAGWYNRGLCYYYKSLDAPTREGYEKAAADFSQAIKLDPNTADNWMFRGHVYSRLMIVDFKKSLDQAVSDYTKAIALDPKAAGAYSGRGRVYAESNDLDKALTDLNAAIRLDGTDAVALFTRAKVHRFKNDLAAARADINAALKIAPTYEAAQIYLKYLDDEDRKAKKPTTAVALAKPTPAMPAQAPGPSKPSLTALSQSAAPGAVVMPANLGGIYTQAENAAKAGDHSRAIDLASQALRLIPLNADAVPVDELLTSPHLNLLLMRARANAALAKLAESDEDFQAAGLAAMAGTTRYMAAANDRLRTETGSGGAIIVSSIETFKAVLTCTTGFKGANEWIAAVKKSRPGDLEAGLKAGITSLGLREICSQAHVLDADVKALHARAVPSSRLKYLNDAISAYSEAISLTPRDPAPYVKRAKVYRDTGRPDLAEADERKARELPATQN